MTPADVLLLLRKTAVGVAVAIVPIIILVGGLSLTRALLDRAGTHSVSTPSHLSR